MLHGLIQLGHSLLQDLTGRPREQNQQDARKKGLESLRNLSKVVDVPAEELGMLQRLVRPFIYDSSAFLKA